MKAEWWDCGVPSAPMGHLMARSPRLFIPGAVYHVHCRTARGEIVFSDRTDATQLVVTIADVAVFLQKHPGSVSRWLETPTATDDKAGLAEHILELAAAEFDVVSTEM